MTKDDFFAWLHTGAGIEDETLRLEIIAKAEKVFDKVMEVELPSGLKTMLPEGSYIDPCPRCNGKGFTVECCGLLDDMCCNSPVQKSCDRCLGTGSIIFIPSQSYQDAFIGYANITDAQLRERGGTFDKNTPPW